MKLYDNFSGVYTLLHKSMQYIMRSLLFAPLLNCNSREVDHKMNFKDPHLSTVLSYAKKDFEATYNFKISPEKTCDNCQKQLTQTYHCTMIYDKIYCGAMYEEGCASAIIKINKCIEPIIIPAFYFIPLETFNINSRIKYVEYIDGLYAYAVDRYNHTLVQYGEDEEAIKNISKKLEVDFKGLASKITYVCSLLKEECIYNIETKLGARIHKITKSQIYTHLYIDKIINLYMIANNEMLWQILMILSCADLKQIEYINKKNLYDWDKLLQEEYHKISTSNKDSKESENSLSLSVSNATLSEYHLHELIQDLEPLLLSSNKFLLKNPSLSAIIAHAFRDENSYHTESLKKFLASAKDLNSIEEKALEDCIVNFKEQQKTNLSPSLRFVPIAEKTSVVGIYRKGVSRSGERKIIRLDNKKANGKKTEEKKSEDILKPFYKEEIFQNSKTEAMRKNSTPGVIKLYPCPKYTQCPNTIIYTPIKKTKEYMENTNFHAGIAINRTQPAPRLNFNYYSPSVSTEIKRENSITFSMPIKMKESEIYNQTQLSTNTSSIGCKYAQPASPVYNEPFIVPNSKIFEKPTNMNIYTDWDRLGIKRPQKSINLYSKEEKKNYHSIIDPSLNEGSLKEQKETKASYDYSLSTNNYPSFNTQEIELLNIFLGSEYNKKLSGNPTLLGKLILLKKEQVENSIENKEYCKSFVELLYESHDKANRNSNNIEPSESYKMDISRTNLSQSDFMESKIPHTIREPNQTRCSKEKKKTKREVGKIREREK